MASGNRFDGAASTTRVEVGAHTAHLARGVACGACHVVPGTLQAPNHNTGTQATVSGAPYNASIAPAGTAEVGFCANL